MAGLDASEEYGKGWKLRFAAGDIPDFFYRLLTQPVLSEAFSFLGVTPAELRRELPRLE